MPAELIDVLPQYTPYQDRLAVPDQDPNFHYRWVSMDHARVEFMRTLGYDVVKVKDTEGQFTDRTVDNSLLMRCPQEKYQTREKSRLHRALQLLRAPRDRVKQIGERLQLEVTDQTREYRAPMSAAIGEPKDDRKPGEGTITREMVQQFNTHKE